MENIMMDILNTKETAAYLKVHVETIRRLARDGDIPAFKIGKDWRFDKEVLRRWIEGKRLNMPGNGHGT
ncbi:MAG: helix-turn-helix domain-containing protein [Proteobacteria bacterium]|nr:helix-turn-helix domain-containing protein [Pseudomonadota bacterium]